MTENTARLLRALLYLLRCEARKPGGARRAATILREIEAVINA